MVQLQHLLENKRNQPSQKGPISPHINPDQTLQGLQKQKTLELNANAIQTTIGDLYG